MKYTLIFLVLLSRLLSAQSTVATGDARGTVSEPTVPTTYCATITATKYIKSTTTLNMDPYNPTSSPQGVLGATGGTSLEPSSSNSSYVMDETNDNAAFNAAQASCPSGQAILLKPGSGGQRAFVLASFTQTRSFVGPGIVIYGSRFRSDYGSTSGYPNCGLLTSGSSSCRHFILAPNASNIGWYEVTFEDRGWDRFGDGPANQGFYVNRSQMYCNKHNGAINGYAACIKNSAGTNSYGPNGMDLVGVSNYTLYKVVVRNSGNFSINFKNCHDVTIWGVKVVDPFEMSNTDGIDLVNCHNVTYKNVSVSDGDNPISLKSTNAETKDVSILDSQFSGIGVVLGTDQAGGIHNIYAARNVHKGNLNNVEHTATQIGSSSANGGDVGPVTFEKGCAFDNTIGFRFYSNYGGQSGTSYPNWHDIWQRDYHFLATLSGGHSGKFAIQGLSGHTIGIELSNITIDGTNDGIPSQSGVNKDQYATVYRAGAIPASIISQLNAGISITQTGSVGSSTPYPCTRSMYKAILGELNLRTPSQAINSTYNNTGHTAYTIEAYQVQPANAVRNKEAYPLTQPISFFDNGVLVGSSALIGDGTSAELTVSSSPTGLHSYIALYPGDAHYAAFAIGPVTVDNGGTTPPPPPPPSPAVSVLLTFLSL